MREVSRKLEAESSKLKAKKERMMFCSLKNKCSLFTVIGSRLKKAEGRGELCGHLFKIQKFGGNLVGYQYIFINQ